MLKAKTCSSCPISSDALVDKTRHMNPTEIRKTAADYLWRGNMFEVGKEVPPWNSVVSGAVIARFYFEASARLGNSEAMNKMGVYHSKGKGGLPIDGEKALAAYTEASSGKNCSARAKRNIATFHARGLGGLDHDNDMAYRLLREVHTRNNLMRDASLY
jgi:TPR repeat protein